MAKALKRAGKKSPARTAVKKPARSLVEIEPAEVKASERKRAREAIRRLVREYPDAGVQLRFRNAWELMVATILAAQCTDKRVNEVTPDLFERYPVPQEMAKANLRTLEKLIRSTGFFRHKAKSIKGASRAIVEDFGGRVPGTMAELLTLPGLGRKTANVVLADGLGKVAGVVVDTHNIRLANLLGFVKTDDPVAIEKFWVAVLDRRRWNACGHVLYAHGQAVCIARRPRHDECVLRDICPAATAT